MIKKGKKLPTLISSILIGMSVPAYGENALQELENYVIDNAQNIVDAGEDRTALQRKLQQLQEEKQALKTTVDKLVTGLAQLSQQLERLKKEEIADNRSKAESAQSAAKAAQDTADDGVSKAKAAQDTANTAVSDADTAKKTAKEGVSKAKAAQNTANTAVSNANSAQKTANNGVYKANAAQGTANDARNLAIKAQNLPSDYFKLLTRGDGWRTSCCDISYPTCPSSHPRHIATWASSQNGGKCGYCAKSTLCMK